MNDDYDWSWFILMLACAVLSLVFALLDIKPPPIPERVELAKDCIARHFRGHVCPELETKEIKK